MLLDWLHGERGITYSDPIFQAYILYEWQNYSINVYKNNSLELRTPLELSK